MKISLDLLGAITAHIIYISSILTFASRLIGKPELGRWFGVLILLSTVPLVYLLAQAKALDRPALYYVQIGAMLFYILVLFLTDYYPRFDFRHTRWMVIAYVMLYFAGAGGMIGVAAHAGRGWTLSAVVFFLIAAALAFVQRAVTGM
jgi:hypothetical protein